MRGVGTWGFEPRNAIEAIHHYERFTGWKLGELAPNIPEPKSSQASNMLEYLYEMEKIAYTEHVAWVQGGRVGREPSLAAKVKGWGGWIGEGLCGSNPNAKARKDLGFLEVKTFGVTPDWKLREKFLPLTSFTWQKVNDYGFNDIKVKQKITQSLLVPIIKHDAGIGRQATADEIANFMLGPPMVFLPDEPTVQACGLSTCHTRVGSRGKSCASQSQHIQSPHLVGPKHCWCKRSCEDGLHRRPGERSLGQATEMEHAKCWSHENHPRAPVRNSYWG